MLVITRKRDESLLLFVGDVRIEILTLSVRGNRAQYGIIAPKSVRAMRAEIEHRPLPISKEATSK